MKKRLQLVIRILTVLLAVMLLCGALCCAVAVAPRAEEKQGDATGWYARKYEVALPTQEMYLLYTASKEGTLAFEIAAQRIRERCAAQDALDFWLPYTLDPDTFSEIVRHGMNHFMLPVSSSTVSAVPEMMAFQSDISQLHIGEVLLTVSETDRNVEWKDLWRLHSDLVETRSYSKIDELSTLNGKSVMLCSLDGKHYTPGNAAYAEIWGGTLHRARLEIGNAQSTMPTYLEKCEVYPISEIFATDPALAAAAQSEMDAIHATALGVRIYLGVTAAVALLLLIAFIVYRACINRERKTDKYLITLRVSCVLLAVFLSIGALAALDVHLRREERRDYYATQTLVLSTGFDDYADTYYLWLWSDEEMSLLQRAAEKGALYYEIAADYVRHWQASVQGLDYVDCSWLPYELDYKTYLQEVETLLDALHVPVLPDGHETVFEYGDIRIYRDEIQRRDAVPVRIEVELTEKSSTTDEQVCTCMVSILYDPQEWQNMYDSLDASYDHYETLTTVDGYEVNYYTSEFLDGKVENGSSWGEVYVDKDQHVCFNVAVYHYDIDGRDSLKSLSDSTLISYAEHLETNEELHTRVEKQWRTITLVHHTIILYITIILLLLLQLTASAILYGKRRAQERANMAQAEQMQTV
ncbi:MAG: hypothetical protein IJW40_03870 [Clostridia bacterium]|nr:hypothetical protein [Clostridia bacterium]